MRRVALVTGAGRRAGLGAAIARALAPRCDLLLHHWPAYDAAEGRADEDGVEAVATTCRAAGARVEALPLDLARDDAAVVLLDAAEARLGAVSVLVNNAAHSRRDGLDALDAAGIDAHWRVNARAPMLLCAEFARRLRGGWGRVVNLTSGQGLAPMPDELAYAASKGALEAFTASFAAAVAPRGASANAVDPGPTDTGWMSAAQRAELRAPLGRLAEPEDAARLVAFLCSDEGGWVTGQVIHSRGGR